MAIRNLDIFAKELRSFVEHEVPNKMMQLQVDTAVHLIELLTAPASAGGTPVDTGFAVSNWRMAVDSIPNDVLGSYSIAKNRKLPYRPGDQYRFKVKGRPMPPLTGLKRQELQFNALYDFMTEKRLYYAKDWNKLGHTMYVFNNVHYLQKLENGHSKQAPAGFVKRAIASTRVWLQARRP